MAALDKNGIVGLLKRRWLTILLVVIAGFFIAQNRNRVSVNLFWIELTSPLWVILLVLFIVGLAAGMITFRRRSKAKSEQAG
ncbi:LapA family protein [Nakamurella lactea]|uniref:LapA family protein n=1 Tax=Nakamurella lactea TaxID=459515 RepID=UPI0003F7B976|nr:LapA family protein [Nakamurella lactea]